MCSTPNPSARSHTAYSGMIRTAAPRARSSMPIQRIARTENVPPAVTPAPYSDSHTPGISVRECSSHSAHVSIAPATSAGAITHATLRSEPDQSGTLSFLAFCALNSIETMTERMAVGSHTVSAAGSPRCNASHGATKPRTPTATSPQPDTAVNVVDDSMVWRMYASVCFACSLSSWVGMLTVQPPRGPNRQITLYDKVPFRSKRAIGEPSDFGAELPPEDLER